MTTHGALYVTSLLVVYCYLHVVNTTLGKQQSSPAVAETQDQHGPTAAAAAAAAAAAETTNDVNGRTTRHNRSSFNSAASLLCNGKRCQGKLIRD